MSSSKQRPTRRSALDALLSEVGGVRTKLSGIVLAGSLVLACTAAPTLTEPPPSPSASPSDAPTAIPSPRPTLAAPGFPAQPEGVAWPTEEWAEAELPVAVDRAAIDAATELALNDGGENRVRAIVIVHGGAIVYERYSPNRTDGPDVVMPSYSVAKSVVSAFIGILVRDGLIDIAAPADVPEWHQEANDPRAEITVEHLLHMTSGLPWTDGLLTGSDTLKLAASGDMAAYAADIRLQHEPGTLFDYNSGSSVLLARIIGEIVSETPEDMRAFMDAELFDRIGMEPIQTLFDDTGTWAGWYSANTTARDFAKFGLLYARGGIWEGAQIVPAEWVLYSRTPSSASNEYGAHWWLDPLRPEVMYAVGVQGQVITVDPAHDLVIVQLSTIGGELPLLQTEAILDAFADAQL